MRKIREARVFTYAGGSIPPRARLLRVLNRERKSWSEKGHFAKEQIGLRKDGVEIASPSLNNTSLAFRLIETFASPLHCAPSSQVSLF